MDPVSELPTLEGPRVRVRPLCAVDVPALFGVYSDARVMRYWSHEPFRTADDAAWYLRDIDAGRVNGTHYQWGIALRAEDRVIGTTTLFAFDRARERAAIAYILAFEHWGNGYVPEALRLVIAFARTRLALQELHADIDPLNTVSQRLVGKLGFREPIEHDEARAAAGEARPMRRYILDL